MRLRRSLGWSQSTTPFSSCRGCSGSNSGELLLPLLRLEVGEVQRGEGSRVVWIEEAGEGSFYRPDGETERDGQSMVATWLRRGRGMAAGGDRCVVPWRALELECERRGGGTWSGRGGALRGRGGGVYGERWL